MKTVITSTLLLYNVLWITACQPTENNTKLNNSSSKIEELKVKLNATEAQLLNIQIELAKCKGDSLTIDSLTPGNMK